MRRISCRDVEVPDCEWEAAAATDEELLARLREHARSAHRHEVTPDEEAAIRPLIRSA